MRFHDAVLNAFQGACARSLGNGSGSGGGRDVLPVLWLFADHVLLAIQPEEPIYLTLTLYAGGGPHAVVCRFSTLSDQDRVHLGIPVLHETLPRADRQLATAAMEDGDDLTLTLTGQRLFRDDGPVYGLSLAPEWAARGVEALWERALPHLWSAMRQLPHDFPPPMPEGGVAVIAEQQWQAHIGRLRERLDPLLARWSTRHLGAGSSASPLFPPDEQGRPRLFAVTAQPFTDLYPHPQGATTLRLVEGHGGPQARFAYTARMLWTPAQLEDRGFGGREREALEQPLGPGARAFADSPLSTGIIFIGEAGQRADQALTLERYPADCELDRQRGEAEALEATYGRQSRGESLFYLPVHVGGRPWLALYCFLGPGGTDPASRLALMWQRLRIYAEVMPLLAHELSDAVQSAYTDTMTRELYHAILEGDLTDLPALCAAISAAWRLASASYPYEALAIFYDHAAASGQGSSPVQSAVGPSPEHFRITFLDHRGALPFRSLDRVRVEDALRKELERSLALRAREAKGVREGTKARVLYYVENLGHEIKNAVDPKRIEDRLIADLEGIRGALEGNSQAEASLNRLLRTTSRLLISAGLGAALRGVGTALRLEGADPEAQRAEIAEQRRRWLGGTTSVGFAYSSEDVDRYRRSLAHLVTVLAADHELLLYEGSPLESGSLQLDTGGLASVRLQSRSLVFPPVRALEGQLTIAAILAEPVRNAIAGVTEARSNGRLAPEDVALHFRAERTTAGDAVVVDIWNRYAFGAQEEGSVIPSRGVALVDDIARSLGIGSVAQPRLVHGPQDGKRHLHVRATLHSHRLWMISKED